MISLFSFAVCRLLGPVLGVLGMPTASSRTVKKHHNLGGNKVARRVEALKPNYLPALFSVRCWALPLVPSVSFGSRNHSVATAHSEGNGEKRRYIRLGVFFFLFIWSLRSESHHSL